MKIPLPFCVDCIHFLRNGQCSKFVKQVDLVTGNTYHFANNMRLDETKCGKHGKEYESIVILRKFQRFKTVGLAWFILIFPFVLWDALDRWIV